MMRLPPTAVSLPSVGPENAAPVTRRLGLAVTPLAGQVCAESNVRSPGAVAARGIAPGPPLRR
ncbi:hypothetical protein GA0070214_103405 [Micromonospora chaiyaphumensis]|uniref:Uncharacterized protein n=1 Tax=Micromonospora chaiyaphumensis TaxID=307119 RepID=A0A1C4WBC0_9ACTN|nr:hypothetical protein GA0070214_103405 [Micromonospora chaiyaphumensis]